MSKGSRQNRSVPLVKRLALRIGRSGFVLETGFSHDRKLQLRLRVAGVMECCGLVNVRTLASFISEDLELHGT